MLTTQTFQSWNGPICTTCGARYIGEHSCSVADLRRRIEELETLLAMAAAKAEPSDPTSNWSCRPENGGSGVCGCILGGLRVTS